MSIVDPQRSRGEERQQIRRLLVDAEWRFDEKREIIRRIYAADQRQGGAYRRLGVIVAAWALGMIALLLFFFLALHPGVLGPAIAPAVDDRAVVVTICTFMAGLTIAAVMIAFLLFIRTSLSQRPTGSGHYRERLKFQERLEEAWASFLGTP